MNESLDWMASLIFQAALNERRCGELLEALLDGGTATVDAGTGLLVILPGGLLAGLADGC